MLRVWNLIALIVLLAALASTANAQPPSPPGRPGPDHRPGPTVVARVNVNVETDVDVASGAAEEDDEDEDSEDAKDDKDESDIGELLETVLKQAGPGWVIADININVETSIKVRTQGHKPGPPKPPGVNAPPKPPESVAPAEKTEKPATEAPKKKRRKKREQSKPETSVESKKEEAPTGIALNRLKIGDTLELGVTGELASQQQAEQIAQRINVGKNQTLLGMAFVGMMLPEELDSLKVVQNAISSVNATASGSALSVSVAIPKETPGAVKTLVEAALEKK